MEFGRLEAPGPGKCHEGTELNDLIFLDHLSLSKQSLYNVGQFYLGDGNDVLDLGSARFTYVDVVAYGGEGNDWLLGNDGRDTLRGENGNDRIKGYAGNDVLIGGPGVNYIDGGVGTDTASYNLSRASVSVQWQKSSTTVSWAGGSDFLVDVERLQFSDGTLAYDSSGVAGQAYRLYQAAFDRAPDAAGLGYWIRQLDAGKGDLAWMANSFINSAEFKAKYGTPATVSNDAFLTLIYNNVLDRGPNGQGRAYWIAEPGF